MAALCAELYGGVARAGDIMASERIKFTAYGEAELHYKGTANIDRGLSFGDSKIERID